MNLQFDPAAHQYTVDGTPVPSVTQLVSPLGTDMDEPDPLLEGAMDAAADRGITMHDYLAFRLGGGDREDYELPDAYAVYADGVDLFLSEHDIEPLLIEKPLAGDGFAGTPDLVAVFDGVTTILDYKFVSQVSKSKVAAQLAGYLRLCDANGIYTEELTAVQFLPGDYRLYPVCTAWADKAFATCLTLYTYKHTKHPRGCIGKE